MIIYNVTIKIEKAAEAQWLQWMKQKHVPDMMGTGMFLLSRICKLVEEPGEHDSTYVFQYECESMQKLNQYIKEYSPALRADAAEKFKDQFVAFRTVMEVVG